MQSPPIPIIFEDNHLLAVVKPPNIPSQADASGDPDMLTLLKADLKKRRQKPGNVYLGLVHRLDRPVGGVMVFAKTSKAASRLSRQIRERSFRKIYLAVIHGCPTLPNDRLIHYLKKDSRTNTVYTFKEPEQGAQEAILDYTVLQKTTQLSIVKVKLHTGRPHQIRVQFASIGYPLFGDQKYGTNYALPGQQIALWSYAICFQHPTRQETLKLSKPPSFNLPPWHFFPDVLG
jgi:23S rRNA pseudouridine1911/1915/1917 synthase